MKLKLLLILTLLALVTACSSTTGSSTLSQPSSVSPMEEIELGPDVDVRTTAALQGRDDVVLIDVREQWEYDEAHIPNITLIPMSEIPNRLNEIPKNKEVIITCRSGNRSGQVTEFLRQNGFENVHNMQGGIIAWQQAGYGVEQ